MNYSANYIRIPHLYYKLCPKNVHQNYFNTCFKLNFHCEQYMNTLDKYIKHGKSFMLKGISFIFALMHFKANIQN